MRTVHLPIRLHLRWKFSYSYFYLDLLGSKYNSIHTRGFKGKLQISTGFGRFVQFSTLCHCWVLPSRRSLLEPSV